MTSEGSSTIASTAIGLLDDSLSDTSAFNHTGEVSNETVTAGSTGQFGHGV